MAFLFIKHCLNIVFGAGEGCFPLVVLNEHLYLLFFIVLGSVSAVPILVWSCPHFVVLKIGSVVLKIRICGLEKNFFYPV